MMPTARVQYPEWRFSRESTGLSVMQVLEAPNASDDRGDLGDDRVVAKETFSSRCLDSVCITSSTPFVVTHFPLQYLMYLIQSCYHEGLWATHTLVDASKAMPSTQRVLESSSIAKGTT